MRQRGFLLSKINNFFIGDRFSFPFLTSRFDGSLNKDFTKNRGSLKEKWSLKTHARFMYGLKFSRMLSLLFQFTYQGTYLPQDSLPATRTLISWDFLTSISHSGLGFCSFLCRVPETSIHEHYFSFQKLGWTFNWHLNVSKKLVLLLLLSSLMS